jgi:acyl carrier protein
MTKREFLLFLDDLFEVDPGTLQGTERLADLEMWDSMTSLGFIALVDEKFNHIVSGDAISQSKTIDDLVALVGTHVHA